MRICVLAWLIAQTFLTASIVDNRVKEKAAAMARTGKLQQAEALLRSALASDPDSATLHGELGQVLIKEDKYEESVEQLGLAVQQLPESREYNMALAEGLMGWGHFPVAVEFLRAVQPRFQQYPEFHYDLGLAYYNMRRTQDAAEEFEKTLHIAPNIEQARFLIERARFLLAACWVSKGDLKSAIDIYRSLVKQRPTKALYWLGLGQALDAMGESDRPEALRACRRALALKPRDPDIEFRTAVILTQMGSYEAARPLLEHVVHVRPDDSRAHVALARTYAHLGQPALARKESAIVRTLEEKSAESSHSPTNQQANPPDYP